MARGAEDATKREELEHTYTVDWAAELGQGTHGKVYLGSGDKRGCAIKMLRDCQEASRIELRGAILMPGERLMTRSGDTLLWACTRTSFGQSTWTSSGR